ncbi:MAG: hypothetical protein PWP27_36 [Clostridiales bacterium]|jgi:ribosomal protein L40E|nr:hypothetical protein [Clostridiales bacterium]MDK2932226.1 hypothetical protein [Clostridiales bacterium]
MSIINEMKNKVTHTAKSAIQKSNEIVEVTKLNIAMGDAQSRIDGKLKDIGKVIYDIYKSGEILSEEITAKCLEIDEIVQEIDKMKEKLALLRKIKICPNCGKENETDAFFCSKCGSRMDEE